VALAVVPFAKEAEKVTIEVIQEGVHLGDIVLRDGRGGASDAGAGGGEGYEEDAAMMARATDGHHHPGTGTADQREQRFGHLAVVTDRTWALCELAAQRIFTSLHSIFPS
jgi:hypothetical protein